MAIPPKLSFLAAPRLTGPRMALAMIIAAAADGIQLISGPWGWVGFDQAVDCVVAVLITWVIGFHILLLPTFVVELIPVLDDLPTWIACTAAVIALRKREQSLHPPTNSPLPAQPAPTDKPIIDV